MFLFLWIMLVLAAIGFFLWSYHSVFEQKRAWKAFAVKYNLMYTPGRMLDSPSMTGLIKDRDVNLYPLMGEDNMGKQTLTNVVEVFMNKVPDVVCVVASQGFADFVTSLELPEPFQVEDMDWPRNSLARTLEDEMPQDWFAVDRDRIRMINQLSKLPFAFAFVADGQQAFIAIRTTNPLSEPKKLNQLVMKMIKMVETLERVETKGKAKPSKDDQPKTANPKGDSVADDTALPPESDVGPDVKDAPLP